MPWPGPQLRLILLLLILAILGPPGIIAEGNVGCLFSERICLEEEWCYNDLAFGRCLPTAGDLDEDDLFRFGLQQDSLHDLSKELRRLFALGYRWGHSYTQCRLQGMLYTLKHGIDFEPDSCSHLSDNDLEGALRALEGQVQLDPQEVAIIKYTPSVDNPHADFADEVYYPPVDNSQQEQLRRKILGPGAGIDLDMPDPLSDYKMAKRTWIPSMKRRSITPFFDGRYGVPKYRRVDKEPIDSIEFLHEYENEFPSVLSQPPETPRIEVDNRDVPDEEMYPLIKLLQQLNLSPKEVEKYLSKSNYRKLINILNAIKEDAETEPSDEFLLNELLKQKMEQSEPNLQAFGPDEKFALTYNTPENFRAGWEAKDSALTSDDLAEPRIYFEEDQDDQGNTEYGSGHPDEYFSERALEFLKPREVFRELKQQQEKEDDDFDKKWKTKPVVYSEGGAEPEDFGELENQQEIAMRDDLSIWDRYNMGFKRPERLDVKKPGPPFDPAITEMSQRALATNKFSQNNLIPSMIKKEPRGANPNPNSIYDTLKAPSRETDESYVHVEFQEPLRDWKQGKDIMRNISNLLHMEQRDFTDGQVHLKSVSFKVGSNNNRGYDANEVAKKIELIKEDLENLTGVEVISAGVGNKIRMQNVYFKRINTENQYIVIFLVCGVLVALILATIVLSLIRRHIKYKEKLQGLSRPDTEASKDYQDLCRARMATKGQTTDGAPDKGRITSLSRESEQSPSSRSSTSSWIEEPALHNMDISTGHMVLSYMEDHLKNKDRLDQEWVALCAYVAEPCETSIAMRKDNVEKNRYPEVVPYDHARVILNELSNANSADYINASSITDHDPRNPAYIATQGPLPHTAPDFWQLIWEQGAVVIVMLTRLTEGGTAMCHRYWPEEGSEVYHIYEVHLVSEHIWCDDYLVRSFYLKNVRTGETRTVTQFHFLSWPEAGVPASTKALLEFRRKVNKSYRGRSCPIVVHCSDGAGRTGTYCLIDMVLSRMAKGAKEIDIAATLEHLRDQRPKMVATKQQFEFVLTAVAEEVHAILKALPPQPSPAPQGSQEKLEK
ncbi:receptor-type tyrosine-protein phosphatase N2 [Sitophilus oryzae]|uniref:Receptor-type tyrosine-protein phosphatase N2 n=1 Tax=Sitophilus oryzae TaxID=7048 RepID=A0A6J2XIG9_SITOR|nr:receptor-type tyrosine-protein phosphatase N2 [Sitophilus oryzae]XP_030751243.1 receptor-type tyrosine-protein phosphatase N2 [Sitophilus oryzae]XP_030751244.1 receptor-type tyrosine-protein phosphatase N2 [Sitophilus oryzae]